MASSPKWKVYDVGGRYVAACKEPEAAACLCGMYGDGSTVRFGHRRIVWREGAEEMSGGESYDGAAAAMASRVPSVYGGES